MQIGKKVKEWDIPRPIKVPDWPKVEPKPEEIPVPVPNWPVKEPVKEPAKQDS